MALPKFNSNAEERTAVQTGAVTIDSLAVGWQNRTYREALDEIARELGVRERMYVRWVTEGKHSVSDATDRLQRMICAASVIQLIVDNPEIAKQISCLLAETSMNSPK